MNTEKKVNNTGSWLQLLIAVIAMFASPFVSITLGTLLLQGLKMVNITLDKGVTESFLMFLMFTFLLLSIIGVYHRDLLALKPKMELKQYLIYACFGFLVIFLAGVLRNVIVMAIMPAQLNTANQQSLEAVSPFFLFFSAVLVSPLLEEIIYRLAIFKLFPKQRLWGLIASTLLFTLVHLNLSKGPVVMLVEATAYLPASLTLSYFYYKHQDLYLTYATHLILNIFAFSTMVFFGAR